MSYLITLTIGPVQSYISQARRTQDLWQGSRILSYLAGKGVDYLKESKQAELIYPQVESTEDDNNNNNIPNRIVAEWRGDERGAVECAEGVASAIREAWNRLSDNTMHYILNVTGEGERERIKKLWERQKEAWLECYWVVTAQQEDYGESIKSANRAMGARKLLRDFPQIDEKGRKCSITGEHEALFGRDSSGKRRNGDFNLRLLGQHERLSAISAIKRFAHMTDISPLQVTDRYPSTSSIAAITFKYDVLVALSGENSGKLEGALERFIEALLLIKVGKDTPEKFDFICKSEYISKAILESEVGQFFLNIDGDFLFEDTFIPQTIEEYSGKAPSSKDLREAREALNTLVREAGKLNIARPEPYFAILSMDGDSMGKTLGTLDREQHKIFSETLAMFARKDVPCIVEQENLGRLVYAGGDDVLALVPIRYALPIANQLRIAFQKRIHDLKIKNHKGEAVTASTGIAIVHQTHDLQGAVRAANQAQKEAKEIIGRNAIVVKFLRRSGEPRSMGGKWVEGNKTLLTRVRQLIKAFGDGLSRSFPADITQIAYSMGGTVEDEAVEAELKRVLNRRFPAVSNGEVEAQVEEWMAEIKQDVLDSLPVYAVEIVYALQANDETLQVKLKQALKRELKKERDAKIRNLGEIIMGLQKSLGWDYLEGWVELARFIAQRTAIEGA